MHPETRAREVLREARHLFVVSGAGISAASGIPTFRGPGGLWKGFSAEELANPAAFRADPERIWEWYRWRRGICRSARPNAAHSALVTLEDRLEKFFLATQNVDGLHREAGTRRQVELHGCIDEKRCTECGHVEALNEDPQSPPESLPSCGQCGGLARPHILWFGETYWPGIIETAGAEAQAADVCLVVGTSGMVWPPMALALASQRAGAFLIEVNPESTSLSAEADLCLRMGADQVLPELL